MIEIETIHHVSVPVRDLEQLKLSKQFYTEILGLKEIERPAFNFPGAWYQVGDRFLHLIVQEKSTFRTDRGGLGKEVDSHDIHFAIRVKSYHETREFLHSKGYHPEATDKIMKMIEHPTGVAGFSQLYIVDPNWNVIELNTEQLDEV